MGKSKKLNLGSGKKIMKGYINLDWINFEGVDVVHDVNEFPYPFKDGEMDEVLAENILEHVDDLPAVMEEIHRILKEGGVLKILIPYFASKTAFIDPTHKYFLGYFSFDYFMKDNVMGYFDFGFSDIEKKLIFPKGFQLWNWLIAPFANRFPQIYEDTFLKVFSADYVYAELTK